MCCLPSYIASATVFLAGCQIQNRERDTNLRITSESWNQISNNVPKHLLCIRLKGNLNPIQVRWYRTRYWKQKYKHWIIVAVAVTLPISCPYSSAATFSTSEDLSELGPQTPELQCSSPGHESLAHWFPTCGVQTTGSLQNLEGLEKKDSLQSPPVSCKYVLPHRPPERAGNQLPEATAGNKNGNP